METQRQVESFASFLFLIIITFCFSEWYLREPEPHHPDCRMGWHRVKRPGSRHLSADTDHDGGRLTLLCSHRSNSCEPHPYSVGQSDTDSSHGHPQRLHRRRELVPVRFRSGVSRIIVQRSWLTGWPLHLPLSNPSHHARPPDRHRQPFNTFPTMSVRKLLSCGTVDRSCSLLKSDTGSPPPL